MIPQKTIEDLINKHSDLEKSLSNGKIEKKIFAEKSKEYSDLNEIIHSARKYISFEKEKSELEKIFYDEKVDDELKKMAEKELNDLLSQTTVYDECNLFFVIRKHMNLPFAHFPSPPNIQPNARVL